MRIMKQVAAPNTIDELLFRCQQMAGKTLAQLAAELEIAVPDNLLTNKGWVGQLFEHYLGADAGSNAEPDFTGLGVEMKTLPLNKHGKPKESTYVCTLNLGEPGHMRWEASWVKHKLAKVLWVPVEADRDIPLAERFVGSAWLWQPSKAQEAILKRDWEELMDRVVSGEQADISAKEGEYLQIRPKAAHSKVMARTNDADGGVLINPKGFYLRSQFTAILLANQAL